jgi:peroxiredoxin
MLEVPHQWGGIQKLDRCYAQPILQFRPQYNSLLDVQCGESSRITILVCGPAGTRYNKAVPMCYVRNLRASLFVALVLSVRLASGQATESSIISQIRNLRSVPDDRRPAVTAQIAKDIRTLPPGKSKLGLADSLSHLVTEGDPGQATLQAVGDTLAQALSENPIPPKNDKPPMPYMDLARLIRYEGVTTDLKDPLLEKALAIYEANDSDAAKADFTLKDLKGKPVTLSQLRGKMVLVNFWATWCPPCRKEMADLDTIYTHFQPQGLVVLSISAENPFTVNNFIQSAGYHPTVLLDDGGNVAKQFHVDGIPRTFVFDREGKLAAQATDMRTQQQFLRMLAAAGLKPM